MAIDLLIVTKFLRLVFNCNIQIIVNESFPFAG